LPTYSGRAIERGTGSIGDTVPGRRAVRTGMTPRIAMRTAISVGENDANV
jgi:hypothetical protein